jgi:glycosyltransferase involved in cell wall biosynthesis
MIPDNPPICIVIRTYFRAESLAKVLNSILALNYPKDLIEVIITSDPNDTNALKISEEFKARGIKLEIVTIDVNSADVGRNTGIKKCGNEIVAVVDDDVVLDPETVNVALKYLRDERVVAVGFPAITSSPSFDEKLHHWRFLGLKAVEAATVAPVTFYKRSMLLKIGLYREDMGPPLTIHEDWELGSRIRRSGYKVLVSGELYMLHIENHLGSRNEDIGIAVDRHKWSILVNMLRMFTKHVIWYFKAYTSKHWWSFFQVLKVSHSSQKLEYAVYYMIPLIAILLLVTNIFWFLTFLVVVLAFIEVYSFIRGYYRVLSARERLVYPVILVLVRVTRSYLALIGLLYNIVRKAMKG